MHTQADITSSQENFNFEPVFSLEEGIKHYVLNIKDMFKMPID